MRHNRKISLQYAVYKRGGFEAKPKAVGRFIL